MSDQLISNGFDYHVAQNIKLLSGSWYLFLSRKETSSVMLLSNKSSECEKQITRNNEEAYRMTSSLYDAELYSYDYMKLFPIL